MRVYSPEIQQQISNIQTKFENTIQHLEKLRSDKIDKNERVEDLPKRIRKVRSALARFNCIIENLPNEFELSVKENSIANRSMDDIRQNRRVRKKYNKTRKRNFQVEAANALKGIQQLKVNGLNDRQIEQLKQKQRPQTKNGELLDLTVDHEEEIQIGGSTEFDNLYLVPEYINALKNDFIKCQTQTNDIQLDNILVMKFAEKIRSNDPLFSPNFPNGFRPETKDITGRISQYMKCDYI